MIKRYLTLKRRIMTGLGKDSRGIAATELGLIAPVLFLMLMAFFDFAHSLYARTILRGALQQAARDSGLNSSAAVQTDLDTQVADVLKSANDSATVTFTRRFYKSYTQAANARAETHTDSPVGNPFRDGICNNGESFVDTNNNGTWDSDGADAGQGGSSDDVLYTVTASYPRVFPMHNFLGWSHEVTISASTILENQPWADQTQYGAAGVGQCT